MAITESRSENTSTLFIVVAGGFSARYLLRTDILQTLKERDVRTVIITTNANEDYFRKEFEDERIIIEPFESRKVALLNRYRVQRWAKMIRSFVSKKGSDVTCLDTRLKIYLNQSQYNRMKKNIIKGTIYALRQSKLLRKVWVCLESLFFSRRFHEHLFSKYKPSLLITTSLGNMWNDHYMIREARRRGVKVLSVILSWDNPSTKGMEGAKIDYVLVWTERMKEEIVRYYDIHPDKIQVGGVAHFDVYRREETQLKKEEIFQQFGLEPHRKLILVGTKSPTSYPYNPDVVEILAKAIWANQFILPCQILVRLHPNHFRVKGKSSKIDGEMGRFKELQEKYGHIYLDIPEVISDRLPMDMPKWEGIKLASLLKNTDVLVTMFSTLMLEASLCDVPVVNAAMFTHNVNLDIHDDIATKFPHIARILATGGVSTSYTAEAMIREINEYLGNPAKNREGRKEIVRNECHSNLGHAGAYIGTYIAQLCNQGK